IGWPRLDAEILPAILRVVGMEARADLDVGIRTGAVSRPQHLAARRVERLEPAAHSELTATVADVDLAAHHQRRHRHRLADLDVAELGLPHRMAGGGIDRDGAAIERVEVD